MLLSLYNSNKKKEIKQMPFAIDIPKEYIIIQDLALTLEIKTIHTFLTNPKTFGINPNLKHVVRPVCFLYNNLKK